MLVRFGLTALGVTTAMVPLIASLLVQARLVSGNCGNVTVVNEPLIGVLNNGLVLMNVNPYVQQITIGLILVAVVAFDQFAKSRRLK